MGNSDSHNVSSSAAATLAERQKKEKKRCKKFACCCVWCNVAAIISLIVGAVLLGYFASSLGSNYTRTAPKQAAAKNLTYTGFAFLGLGALLVCVGVCLVILLVVTYRRMSGKGSKVSVSSTCKYSKLCKCMYIKMTFSSQDILIRNCTLPTAGLGEHPEPHHPEANPTPAAAPDVEDNPPPYNKTTEALITPEIN
ncbi:hypothetical protein EB796_012678 [Bugula neritina]|uniref:Uncharacterized protein n=1 Tax=Bugula neritina TaxID=10212 RepID=A0A7J7JUG2_BUGNE|nr:hypothetical protein EB796_012678 [Bugula neritina]